MAVWQVLAVWDQFLIHFEWRSSMCTSRQHRKQSRPDRYRLYVFISISTVLCRKLKTERKRQKSAERSNYVQLPLAGSTRHVVFAPPSSYSTTVCALQPSSCWMPTIQTTRLSTHNENEPSCRLWNYPPLSKPSHNFKNTEHRFATNFFNGYLKLFHKDPPALFV